MTFVEGHPDLQRRLRDIERRISARDRHRPARFDEETAEVTTIDIGPVNLGGPSVRLTGATGAFIAVLADVEIKTISTNEAHVYLNSDSPDWTFGPTIIRTSNLPNYSRFLSEPALRGSEASIGYPVGAFLVFPFSGEITLSLEYGTNVFGQTAYFRKRRLHAFTL